MKQDRFLLAILTVIALLVFLALGLFFLRQANQQYGAEDTPAGVLRNYIIALQKEDYNRAYTYLADKEGKPESAAFKRAFINRELDISTAAIQIGATDITGNSAEITLAVIRSGSGLFNEGSRETQSALLLQVNGAWKISQMPYPYWNWDWMQAAVPAVPVSAGETPTPTPEPTPTPAAN